MIGSLNVRCAAHPSACVQAGSQAAPKAAAPLRRLFCLLLSAVLALSLVPASAWAQDGAEGAPAAASSDASSAAAADAGAGEGQGEGAPGASTMPGEEAGGAEDPGLSGQASQQSPEPFSQSGSSLGDPDATTPAAATDALPSRAPQEGQTALALTDAETRDAAEGQGAHVTVTCSVVGADADGAPQTWAAALPYTLDEGATAADVTKAMFEKAGISYGAAQTDWGWSLDSVTSPFDSNLTLAMQQVGGEWRYWQLFVNGNPCSSYADGYALKAGDRVTWSYSAWGDSAPAELLSVSCSIIGADADGAPQTWAVATSLDVEQGATAADLSESLFAQAGLTASYGMETWGWSLSTITSPFDSGMTLGWNSDTGQYWQLFVNGTLSEVGAGGCVLQAGDVVTWCYGSDGVLPDTPGPDGVVVDPDAVRPDWDSEWPGYASGSSQGAVTAAPTPTESVETAWAEPVKDAGDWSTYVSDPVIVGGKVFIAAGSTLYRKDASTGKTEAQAQLAAPVNSAARMAYADGIVVVPVSGGRLQALTVDALATVWLTDELPGTELGGDQQSIATLTIDGGYAYYATASADWSASYGGFFFRVDLADGSVKWCNENTQAGYYWAGAAVVGGYALIADDAGTLVSVDAETGEPAGTLVLPAGSRSTVAVSGDGATAFVVTKDGTLHKVAVGADGALSLSGSVRFGSSSTCTPALCGGKVIVGGCSLDGYANSWGGTSYYGGVWVIDQDTLAIEAAVSQLGDGTRIPADVKSAPLVSVQEDGTYVYFTSNTTPGGVYAYKLGEACAWELYVPDADKQNYCMSSVVAGADGALYYVNDSGTLFKLVAKQGSSDNPQGGTEGENPAVDGSGAGLGNVGGKTDLGTGGTVPAGSRPLTASEVQGLVQQADDPSGENATAEASLQQAPRAISEGGTDSSPAEDHGASGAGGMLPILGLVAGAVGLAGATAYLTATRRKNRRSGEGR